MIKRNKDNEISKKFWDLVDQVVKEAKAWPELKFRKLITLATPEHHATLAELNIDAKKLARQLADLRYDELAIFLNELHNAILNDSNHDYKNNRPKLCGSLNCASINIEHAKNAIIDAWKICEKVMNKKR